MSWLSSFIFFFASLSSFSLFYKTGNEELTLGQARVQMAVWSILAAPLLMSNDLRKIKPEFKEILLNRKIIAVDQDPMGMIRAFYFVLFVHFYSFSWSFCFLSFVRYYG